VRRKRESTEREKKDTILEAYEREETQRGPEKEAGYWWGSELCYKLGEEVGTLIDLAMGVNTARSLKKEGRGKVRTGC